ncbi:MAG: S8 family peptidase [Planctomycetales bacterium]
MGTHREVSRFENEDIARLIYGNGGSTRFTQDSPILPMVWREFASGLDPRVELLLTPRQAPGEGRLHPGALSALLRKRLDEDRGHGPAISASTTPPPWDVAYHQSTVCACLTFSELIRCVLPMTRWWCDRICQGCHRWLKSANPKDVAKLKLKAADKNSPARLLQDATLQEVLALALTQAGAPPTSSKRGNKRSTPLPDIRPPDDILWLARVIGTIALANREMPRIADDSRKRDEWIKIWTPPGHGHASERFDHFSQVVSALAELLKGMPDHPMHPGDPQVHLVSLNRKASICLTASTGTIKADAARRVFQMSCRELTWAVIDSGVDARHPAFLRPLETQPPAGKSRRKGSPDRASDWKTRSRILATYDFSLIRQLLRTDGGINKDAWPNRWKRLNHKALADLQRNLKDSMTTGRELDWGLVLPFLKIEHDSDAYEPPVSEHGTHVAGIIGASWERQGPEDTEAPEEGLHGVCPDINLYDLRVFSPDGDGDEFTVMAAMQFVRYLNLHSTIPVIHGVNLSLSIPHDPKNYACGRTPVCDECERLVGNGTVVVVAAGNEGATETMDGDFQGFRMMTITDPGNAAEVITVGATHRDMPHQYGVSYFSSRGPTGDGRVKPDLVAPGEKIESCVPNGGLKPLDGTSMAAPHVSGAAALLMARNRELIGRPRRIKEILCETATDLGRERYFQGEGLLDVLRALQSL